jgi:TRAP-type C4-dicarboxylate transport system, small permease component
MKILKFIANYIEELLAAPLMVVMSCMVVTQVACRFVFRVPTPWAEELLRYCFIWSIMMGSAAGVKKGAHIGVTMLVDKLPGKARLVVMTIAYVVVIVASGMFCYASWDVVMLQYNSGQILPALGIPIYTSTLALPVGFVFIIIRSIQLTVKIWREHKVPETSPLLEA